MNGIHPPSTAYSSLIAVIPGAGSRPELVASTVASVRACVHEGTEVLVGEDGAAFGALLLRAMQVHPGRDVACILPGVQTPFAWDARLSKAAHADALIAASMPMCDASPLHGLVDAEHFAKAAGAVEEIDRSAYCMGSRGYYEVPAAHPYCMYIRRDALDDAHSKIDPNADATRVLAALALHWRATGRSMVLCDFIYVGSPPGALAGPYGGDAVEVAAFEAHHPLGALRRSVNEALEGALPPVSTPALDSRPVQLHVMHFWGGGVDKWVRDFARADTARTNLLLATYRIGERGGQRIVLYSDPDAKVPVRTWDIARPLRSTAVSSLEYREILQEIVRDFDVEAIVVSSLIGHTLDALVQPVPTIVVSHDFFPVCPNLNPRFDERCQGCGDDDLERCLSTSDFRSVFGDATAEEWRALRDAFVTRVIERRIEMVVPTRSVQETLTRLDARLRAVPMRVIAHGTDFGGVPLPIPDPTKPLRLVVVGRMNAHKGLELLRAAGKELGALAEITLVGCGAKAVPLAQEMGWDAIEEYELSELPRILESLAPHGAILPSMVPETFSYTLSELWAMGIPPIATALGAFAERIEEGVTGFLFTPARDALVSKVRELAEHPGRLAEVARRLGAHETRRTAADMVADYTPLLPQGVRPVARFRVGIGRETALTEPYRRLDAAYARIASSYDEVQAAYAKSAAAYDHTRQEFERVHRLYQEARADLASLQEILDTYSAELDALHVGTRWWLAPKAQQLLGDMRRKIAAARAASRTHSQQGP